jgi:hypothetical protein
MTVALNDFRIKLYFKYASLALARLNPALAADSLNYPPHLSLYLRVLLPLLENQSLFISLRDLLSFFRLTKIVPNKLNPPTTTCSDVPFCKNTNYHRRVE